MALLIFISLFLKCLTIHINLPDRTYCLEDDWNSPKTTFVHIRFHCGLIPSGSVKNISFGVVIHHIDTNYNTTTDDKFFYPFQLFRFKGLIAYTAMRTIEGMWVAYFIQLHYTRPLSSSSDWVAILHLFDTLDLIIFSLCLLVLLQDAVDPVNWSVHICLPMDMRLSFHYSITAPLTKWIFLWKNM